MDFFTDLVATISPAFPAVSLLIAIPLATFAGKLFDGLPDSSGYIALDSCDSFTGHSGSC
jgi:hypothetical protein